MKKKLLKRHKSPRFTPFQVVSLIAVVVLPLVYGLLYLWAFWDPYGALEHIPVAVVNLDQGGTQDNKEYNLGDKLVEKLKNNTALEWHFVSETSAKNGLDNQKYYAVITIPENFSSNVLSAKQDTAKAAHIILTSREASNFMASKFSETATIRLVSEINKEVETEYWQNIFVSLREIGNKLEDAKDGANELTDGLSTIKDGQATLNDGIQTAKNGSNDLYNGLGTLESGSTDLQNGVTTARDGTVSLSSGLTSLTTGLTVFSSQVSTLQSSMTQVQSGIQSSKAGVDQAIGLLDDPANAATVKAILSQVSGGLDTLSGGVASVSGGLNQAGGVMTQLVAGSSAALTGANQLVGGLNDAVTGSASLSSGISDARNGASTLSNGLTDMLSGSGKLGDGITKAEDGSKTLAQKLEDGQNDVINQSSQQKEDAQVPVLSAPVDYTTQPIAKVPNNGTGFAPYFIPLSMWVGAMALFFIFPNPKLNPKSILIFGSVGAAQALLLTTLLETTLGLRVVSAPLYFCFTICLSWCYMLIQGLVNRLLGDAGKFINIVVLMLQLTGSAGSYPLETTPKFFQTINPYLPMTYAVRGFREIISDGNIALAINQLKVIVYIGTAFFIINAVQEVARTKYAETKKN